MFLSSVLKEFIGRCLCEEQGNCKLVSKIVLEFEMKVTEGLIRNVTYIRRFYKNHKQLISHQTFVLEIFFIYK